VQTGKVISWSGGLLDKLIFAEIDNKLFVWSNSRIYCSWAIGPYYEPN